MNKRIAALFAVTALLLPYCAQAKPTWIVAHTHSSKTTANLKKQVKCLTALTQWEKSFTSVKSAATNEQMDILTNALNQAKQLYRQGRCEEGQAVLTAVNDVLETVQHQWLDNELEDLDRLFMGPSTVEQRAMLRTHIQAVKLFKKKNHLDKAVTTAQRAEELFDNPPALDAKQLRKARYDDAMEALEILYELAGLDIGNNPQGRRQVEKVNTKAQYEIYNIFRDSTLDDAAQVQAYEEILQQAETDLQNFLTIKKSKKIFRNH